MSDELIEKLEREAKWYRGHPRAHHDDHGMCAISPEEADDTAALLEEAAKLIRLVFGLRAETDQ